jgi:hypothetical protein
VRVDVPVFRSDMGWSEEVYHAETNWSRLRNIGGGFGRKLNRSNSIERPLDWNVESQSGEVHLQPRPAANCSSDGQNRTLSGRHQDHYRRNECGRQPTHTETVGGFDGKDNPVKGAQAPNTTNALKRIDDRTFEVIGKMDGKPTVTTRVAVSADGKTITATQTGMNAQGQRVNNVIVLDKQ